MSATTSPALSLLIIDDNEKSLELLSSALAQPGLEIFTASDPEQGIELVFEKHPQIVLTDLVMPNLTGMEVLERIMEFDPSTEVILMTAHYSTESAVEAIKKGASDYLNKPISLAALRERVGKLVEEARKRQRSLQLEGELLATSEFEGIVGRSPVMREMIPQIRRVAPHYRTVLITGETGTGKDLVARALHALSPVAAGRYVVLNCSAVVETLFESELFGHVRGSFTGATSDKAGSVRARPRRHSVSGRNRRYAAGHASQAPARIAEPGSAARGIALGAQGGCPRHRRHQSQSACRGGREALSGGSLLPALHGGDSRSAAGRAQGGFASARTLFRCEVRGASTKRKYGG